EGQMVTPCEGIVAGAELVVEIPPRKIPAQVANEDTASGLCRLAMHAGASWPLRVAGTVPKIGERVYGVNIGATGEVVLQEGVIRSIAGNAASRTIETTFAIGRQHDGGPLLDEYGSVVAIARVPAAAEGRFVAVPVKLSERAEPPRRPPPAAAASR